MIVGKDKIAPHGRAKTTFTLSGTGRRGSGEVAQVYHRHLGSKVSQPKLALCGFRRVCVTIGKTTQVTIKVPADRLRHWDAAKKHYVVEPGGCEFLIGAASDDIRLKLPMTIASPMTTASR